MTHNNLLKKETVSIKTSLKEHKILLYIIAFIAGSLIMVLELIAGRIIAPYVGVSLYTWTSVIGIVLAGISLGNYLGGLIADQKASIQLLSRLFIFTGISCLAVLPLTYFLPQITEKLDLITQILILTIALFFIPCTLLGSISPIVMKLCITNLDQAGSTIGRISALSTIGGIITTFLTGFFLISWFGVNQILFGIASILIFLGLLLSFFFRN